MVLFVSGSTQVQQGEVLKTAWPTDGPTALAGDSRRVEKLRGGAAVKQTAKDPPLLIPLHTFTGVPSRHAA